MRNEGRFFFPICKEFERIDKFAPRTKKKKRIGETRSRPELGFRPFLYTCSGDTYTKTPFFIHITKNKKIFCRYKKKLYICGVKTMRRIPQNIKSKEK